MIGRRIYAHWLDPDYLGRLVIPEIDLAPRTYQFGGFLKMHAICGDSLHISGVQLVESRLLLKSFANPGFRQFIAKHPEFLSVVESFNGNLGATSLRLGTICGGLARLVTYGTYIPNTYPNADIIPAVAALFKGIPDENAAAQLFGPRGDFTKLLNAYKAASLPDPDLVEGLYHALMHFIANPLAGVQQPPKGLTLDYYYFDELDNILTSLDNDYRGVRDAIRKALDAANTEQKRKRRSLVLMDLSNTTDPRSPDRQKYLIIMQAWNISSGRLMNTDFDSAYCFRDTPPIPVFSKLKTNQIAFDANLGNPGQNSVCIGEENELFEGIIPYEWHPADLPWEIISRVRAVCASDIAQYQSSLRINDSLSNEIATLSPAKQFVKYTKFAAKIIAEERLRLKPEPQWVSLTCNMISDSGTVAAPFVAAFDVRKGLELAVGSKAPRLLLGTYQSLMLALKNTDRGAIAKIMQQYGQQYNLHRSG